MKDRQKLLQELLQKKLQKPTATTIIPRRPDQTSFPLSFAQERLWFLDQLEPGVPIYTRPLALQLTGALDVTILQHALEEILQRHEVLRSRISNVDGRPVQRITPAWSLSVPIKDLTNLPSEEREPHAQRVAREESQTSFNLSEEPLLRVTLLRLDKEHHILLLVFHHLVFDAWSAKVFLREFSALYHAFSTGQPSPLPDLPIQYADFASWQRQRLQGQRLESLLRYWNTQPAGAPPVLNLPTDHPRPAQPSYHGASYMFILPSSLLQSVNALSQQEHVTVFMTLLATFTVLLFRYTDREDIVIGTPIAGRTHVETEKLIGCFVNTLALRTDLSGNPSFRELLQRVRTMTLEAYAHQELPFEKLVEELQPERNLSHPPIFHILFNLENLPEQSAENQTLQMTEFEFDRGITQFDLSLELIKKGTELSFIFNYNSSLFEHSTIKRMAGHFQVLLEGIITDPEQSLSNLPLLTRAELHQILVEWNDTKAEYLRDTCIHQLFEAQVKRTPDAVAVVCEDQQLTYRELNSRANQLAHSLKTRGIGPEVLVGICVERSLEMVVGILGILKAGGAYVPLDVAYPKERLAFILEDTHISVLVTQHHLLKNLPEQHVRVVCLDTDWERIGRERRDNPDTPVMLDNVAYIIYTSGSTGKPKGVLNTHYNVVHLFQATQPWFHFHDNDVWSLFHSYAFDFSVWEIWGALFYGGRLVVVPYWVSRSPDIFYELLCMEQVTILNQTPSAFQQLMRAEETSDSVNEVALRLVILGGDALEINSLRSWFARHGDQSPQIVNMYGITETTVHVTFRPVSTTDLDQAPKSVIGGSLPDLQLYVLDRYLHPVPIGVAGELYISGAGLARGYLNRPQLTAERFLANPFNTEPGTRLYKTGDIVRYLPHRDIEYIGRCDSQVKLRGFRIELGEIESVLSQHPSIQKAVVLLQEHGLKLKRLVGYVVPPPQKTLTVHELRSFLREKLPDYMIPSVFVFLDTLPLTPNGKVDRRALPAPDQSRPDVEAPFVAPRTPVEETIAAIWREILGVEQVSVYDNFFDLGGHSLLVMQVIAKIEQHIGIRLTPKDFIFQTLGQIAVVCKEKMALSEHSEPKNFFRKLWHDLKNVIFQRSQERK